MGVSLEFILILNSVQVFIALVRPRMDAFKVLWGCLDLYPCHDKGCLFHGSHQPDTGSDSDAQLVVTGTPLSSTQASKML